MVEGALRFVVSKSNYLQKIILGSGDITTRVNS